MTGSPGIKDDLVNAGAKWVDQEVVVDRDARDGGRERAGLVRLGRG